MGTPDAASSEACRDWMDAVLAPTPLPPGCTSRALVRAAIRFEPTPRLPYGLRIPFGTDFFELATLERLLDSAAAPRRAPGTEYLDAWGVTRRKTRFSWDEATGSPLSDLSGVGTHPLPDPAAGDRIRRFAPFVARARRSGKYVVGADPVLLHERVTALMGFASAMTAAYEQRRGLEILLDRLTDLTVAAIDGLATLGGVDGFMTWQDLAGDGGPWMSPSLFREIYKPRHARVVEAAHRHGMDFFWHTCGQVEELIPDLVDIGVDVVQLDQPRLVGHHRLAERFGGRVCFWNTVDIAWATGAEVSAPDVEEEVAAMLGPFAGTGVMAKHYGDPDDIGLDEEFHRTSARAFFRHGCERAVRPG